MNGIQHKVIGLFRDGSRMLVQEAADSATGIRFCRPPGGIIEFGERPVEALQREMREELGAEIDDLRFISVKENLFTYNARPSHEIVFVFDARFTDSHFYEERELVWLEDTATPVQVRWKEISDLRKGNPPLYPEGILELLASEAC